MASKLSRLFYKDTVISLLKRGEEFFLRLSYGDNPATLEDVLDKWPQAESISAFFDDDSDSQSPVHLDDLEYALITMRDMKSRLSHLKKLIIDIPPDVERVIVCDQPPVVFAVSFYLSQGQLKSAVPTSAAFLPDGWCRMGSEYWKYPKLDEEAIRALTRPSISASEIVDFLSHDIARFKSAGVSVKCDLRLEDKNALGLHLDSIERETVSIRTIWSVAKDMIDQSADIPGHVVANNVVYPGIAPSKLEKALRNPNGVMVLSGIEIAEFFDLHYSELKPWVTGDIAKFESMNRFVEPPYEWMLVASTKSARGVGTAYAFPMACIDEERYSPQELREMMACPYARTKSGWVRRNDLCSLGMDAKLCWSDGKTVEPICLSARQLLFRGDEGLKGPWRTMVLSGIQWPKPATKQDAAREHLKFLLHWGLSGGITGGFEAAAVYAPGMLRALFNDAPDAKVLIVGHNSDLNALKASAPDIAFAGAGRYDASSCQIAYTIRFGNVKSTPIATQVEWDVLLVVEPDELYTSEASIKESSLLSIKAACTIGFFLYDGDSCPQRYKPWREMLLKSKDDEVLKLVVRDTRHPLPLPEPYVFHPTSITPVKDAGFEHVADSAPSAPAAPTPAPPKSDASVKPPRIDEGFDMVMDGEADHGVAIPRSPVEQASSQPPRQQIVTISISPRQSAFFDEARRLAQYKITNAIHTQFSCYWPIYADMNPSQRAWYFFLRDRVRSGEYPDTDLSYLFVNIYELLALVGCSSYAQAYERLISLWKGYRARHPKLDKYLSDWAFDFINVYPGVATLDEFYSDAPALCNAAIDCHLTIRNASQPYLMRLDELEAICDYRFKQSKFYLSGHADIMDKALARVVALIDARLLDTTGKSLFESAGKPVPVKRVAFSSAVIERDIRYEINCAPYVQCGNLRNLVAQIVRFAENELRSITGFPSMLRGITLDSKLADWIKAYIKKNFAKEEKKPASPLVVLSKDSIERLRAESDEVRAQLIASMKQEQPDAVVNPDDMDDAPIRPENTPDGLLTDLKEVHRILKAASGSQMRILQCLRENQWEMEENSLESALPGTLIDAEIDGVNRLSYEQLGVNLIEREGDKWVVAEDYRDELEFLLQKPDTSESREWTFDSDGLDEEWISFFDKAPLPALGVLADGADAFAQYAKERGEMPDLLMDAINMAAMDSIGDIVADEDGVIEDYRDIILTHLRRC